MFTVNQYFGKYPHHIEEGNAKLAASIYKSNPNASKINEIVSISSKLFACNTDLNLKQEDLPMLSCKVSVRNSVCKTDKPTVKYIRKSIYKSVGTSSGLPGKLICDINVRSSKLVSAISVRPSKPIHGSNAHLGRPVTSSIARPK